MVKNVKVMYIIDLRSHVITKCGTVSDEILGILTACIKQIYLLGVTCRVSDRKTLSKENVSFNI